jgi:hypothetical protein
LLQTKQERPAQIKASNVPHIPRKPKSASKTSSNGKTSASVSSDDELTIEDEEPEEMLPAILAISASNDREKAVRSAVEAVWHPRNRPAPPEKIRTGIVGFGEAVRGLRDLWKAKNDKLKQAELENSQTAADAPRLKEEVANYRRAAEQLMTRSQMYGHPSVVKRYVSPFITLPPQLDQVDWVASCTVA